MQIKNLLYDVTMDCYQPNGADTYDDMLVGELDLALFQQQSAMPPVHMVQDNYGSGSHAYSPADHQMQNYSPDSFQTGIPEMDTSALGWLSSPTNGMQHHATSSNATMLVDPVNSIANADPSVQNQSVTARLLTLPNNVQIANGIVNCVSRPSATQQVYVTSTSTSMSTHQQGLHECTDSSYRPRSDSSGSYVLSPSAPTSTVSESQFPKPPYSYSCLIALALKNSQNGSLPVAEIYSFMMRHFPYFKTAPDGWKNSVRHNLSLNKCFEKIENPNADGTNCRKGCLWALNPAKAKKMDDEIFKWNKKDPLAIKRAMSHPEVLDLISKGQESFSARNGLKRAANHNHMRPGAASHSSSLHHQLQQHSPTLSPSVRVVNNGTPPMMVDSSTTNGLSCTINSSIPEQTHPVHSQQQHASLNAMTTNMFNTGSSQMPMDSAFTDLQGALFNDYSPSLPAGYPFSPSSSDFILSPGHSSPARSPLAQHSTDTPVVPNGLTLGTLIPLAQN